MRTAAADLDFEEAARLRDEIKRLRATELAVMDDPTAKLLPSPQGGAGGRAQRGRAGGSSAERAASRIHKPTLDEMGIALHHEMAPHRPGSHQEARSAAGATGTQRTGPRKPTLDEMGPGVESAPAKQEARSAPGATGKQQEARSAGSATGKENQSRSGPRSTLGRPGMRGGWKPRRR
jgi:excinuclease ABC subunit B